MSGTATAAFRWRVTACVAVAGLYAGLLYLSSARSWPALGAAVAIAPPLLVGLALSRRVERRWVAITTATLLLVALIVAWRTIEHHHSLVVMLQQVGVYGALSIAFGRTLRPGAMPLCTRLADLTHGPLDAATLQYTRQVTLAWTLLMAGIALASAVLFTFGSPRAWSLFAAFGPTVLLPAMFVVEYATRWVRLPQLRGVRISAAVRAFMSSGSDALSRRA